MNPGKLDKRIHFMKVKVEKDKRDELGGKIKKLVDYSSTWADETQMRMYEKNKAGRDISEEVYTFIIRERKDIDSKMFVKYKDSTLKIVSIVPLKKFKGYSEMTCIESDVNG